MPASPGNLVPQYVRKRLSPQARQSRAAQLLAKLDAVRKHGRHMAGTDYITLLRRLSELHPLPTLEPFLPVLLNLKGQPYHLRDHYPFSPLFRVARMPSEILYITGRQTSKSTSLASNGIVRANTIVNPHTGRPGNFTILYVMPRYEQVRRFSTLYVRPFIQNSPLRHLWISTSTEKSVLQRSFANDSKMLFSFALLDADRVRGISSDQCCLDECQDMDPDHLPIIKETMSHSPWALTQYTGTPKTLDNPIHGLWQMSSQAEWIINCQHCTTNGFPTKNIPSRAWHAEAMLGPYRDDICEERPGTLCHKCGQPIIPRFGRWVHRYPERIESFPGYHVPQCIMPLHYAHPKKWAELKAKQDGWGNTSPEVFWNEVMGESAESGVKLVTETALKEACKLPWRNDTRNPSSKIRERLSRYQFRLLGIDWGGGGEEGVSFTTVAAMGYMPDGKIETFWGKRLLQFDHLEEALEIRYWYNLFNCQAIAHDYTGAGWVRETVLTQAGLAPERNFPIRYCRTTSKGLLTFVNPQPAHPRGFYQLDKARSLLYTCQAIRLQMIRFFQWDRESAEEAGLLSDFLALVEHKVESPTAGDIFKITKNLTLTDDFAHSVNLGTMALWAIHDTWPNFAEIARQYRVTKQQAKSFGNAKFGWDTDARNDATVGY